VSEYITSSAKCHTGLELTKMTKFVKNREYFMKRPQPSISVPYPIPSYLRDSVNRWINKKNVNKINSKTRKR